MGGKEIRVREGGVMLDADFVGVLPLPEGGCEPGNVGSLYNLKKARKEFSPGSLRRNGAWSTP